MTRILLMGVGPRPAPNARKIYAPGLRLQTFAESLLQAGHEVHIAEAGFGTEEADSSAQSSAIPATVLSNDSTQQPRQLEQLLQQYQPQAIVTSTDVMGNLAACSSFTGPLFCDFFGHPMAERQMQATVAKSNASLADQWRMILPILMRADCFGVCSNAQRHALLGELGAVGRFGFETSTHDFARVLAPANPFNEPFHSTEYGIKKQLPTDSLVLLFSGGYNTWLDEETLFNAVELALDQEPRLHYVSTGGAISGHVTDVFSRFHNRVLNSRHNERFHFVGWLEHDDYLSLALEADAGIIVDEPTLEGVYGCRNRLFSWIWAGMRALATDLSESTREVLVPNGLVTPLPMKNPAAIAQVILQECRLGRFSPEETLQRQRLLQQTCSPAVCYNGLLEWAAAPLAAPDRAGSNLVQNPLADSFRLYQAQPQFVEFLQSLKGSRAFSLFLATQGDKRLLFENLCQLIVNNGNKTQQGEK